VPVYEVPFSFYGGVREGMLCRDQECILEGPADVGKTLALLYKIHRCAEQYPGAQFSILRKVRAHLYGTVIVTWKRDIVSKLPPDYLQIYGGETPLHYTYPNGPDPSNPYDGGSRIWFGGLDNPGQTLSGERDIIYVVQAEEITVSDWEYLIRMATGRGAVMPYAQVIGDCNPASSTHWILQRWNQGNGSLRLFKTTHRDNPVLFDPETGDITPAGEKRLSRLRRLTGHRLKRLYYGVWAPPEGAIFSMYEEETHKVEAFAIPRLWPRFVGVDPFGAKIAAVWVAYDPQGMALHAYREYVQPFGVTTQEHVKQILDLAGYSETGSATNRAEQIFAWVGGGPSERQARLDFSGFGLPLVESPVKDVWAGIGRIQGLMREGRLFIHDCCVNLLSEIGEYRRKQNKRTGEFLSAIENKDSYHCIDSLRYVLSYLTGSGEETQDEVVDYSVRIGPRL
jgi:PBSX family phage terminase large subunit